MMRILTLVVLIVTTTICLGQSGYEEYAAKKISKKQNRIAKQIVQDWLAQKADSLGIPHNMKLSKLIFSPDEIVVGDMNDLAEKKNELSGHEKQEYLKAIAEGDFYKAGNTYINTVTGKEQRIYYAFTQNLKLKGITIFEGEYPPIYQSYPNIAPDQVR